jgi:flagellar hook-basal body complex protein FliE
MIPPIGGLSGALQAVGDEAATQGAHGASAGAVEGAAQGAPGSGATEATSFGGELTEAISSLEKTQQSASDASQALATGNVKDPESAVVTVEDGVMAMDLASQIRGKATEAAQTIFQTQV